MSTRRLSFTLALALAFGAGSAVAETPGLGKPIAEADIEAWDIAILPDGTGLPPGSGTPAQGAPIYAQKCAMCHGENGVNRRAAKCRWSARTSSIASTRPRPSPITGMPRRCSTSSAGRCRTSCRRTLTDDEVYALSAYILALNKIIGETEVMNAQTLPKVKMPNRDNFIIRFPDRI